MTRNGFMITFKDIRSNKKITQEFASYSDYWSAWREVLQYAQVELITDPVTNKYWIIDSIKAYNVSRET